jgi:hypothetical protein
MDRAKAAFEKDEKHKKKLENLKSKAIEALRAKKEENAAAAAAKAQQASTTAAFKKSIDKIHKEMSGKYGNCNES